MSIQPLQLDSEITKHKKVFPIYQQMEQLLSELEKRTLPATIVEEINRSVTVINTSGLREKALYVCIKKQQTIVVELLKKQLHIVPKNHFRTLWMLLGMSAFGVPIGVAIGFILDNIGLLGIGLPFGLSIGTIVGNALDQKAAKEGRQLAISIRH